MSERKLLDFYADWCGPCKDMAPIVEKAKEELSGKLEIEKIDFDLDKERVIKYHVKCIPTFVALERDEDFELEVARLVGSREEADFLKFLDIAFENFQEQD